MANMIAFNNNYDDLSTDAGFQFSFKCESCGEGYKTTFIESKTYRKGRLFRGLGSIAGSAGSIIGQSGLGYMVSSGSQTMSEKFQGMSPEWHKEHEVAFETAQNEAKPHFPPLSQVQAAGVRQRLERGVFAVRHLRAA